MLTEAEANKQKEVVSFETTSYHLLGEKLISGHQRIYRKLSLRNWPNIVWI